MTDEIGNSEQISIGQPLKEVIIKFPNDIDQLVKVLDWIFNSKDIMTISVTQETFDKANKVGRILEERIT